MKRIVVSVIVALMMVFAACGAQTPSGTETSSATETTQPNTEQSEQAQDSETPVVSETEDGNSEIDALEGKFNYEILPNPESKAVRIAVIMVNNNPFWLDVVAGAESVKQVMADKYNCTVDIITVDDFDGQVFAETIDTCVVKEYDAITTVGVSDAIVPAINRAVDAGISVYTFNSDTEMESKRTAFVGQDLYAAGEVAGEKLAELIGGKGKVAIITGLYSVNAHELRRTGIEASLAKYPDITIVGTVENHDSADEAYTAAKDFITAHPDLAGIIVTAGGPHGAAKAVDELGLKDKISVVCFDTTTEIISYIKKDVIKATIGQDPFGQGADPVVLAYNQIISGKAAVTGDAFTAMDAYTPDNISEYFPD